MSKQKNEKEHKPPGIYAYSAECYFSCGGITVDESINICFKLKIKDDKEKPDCNPLEKIDEETHWDK